MLKKLHHIAKKSIDTAQKNRRGLFSLDIIEQKTSHSNYDSIYDVNYNRSILFEK